MARRRRRNTVVQRSDAAEEAIERNDEVETREGRLLNLTEPHFLSIVKAPANRTPFKIVRDDIGITRRRRKAQDAKALLTVTLPEDITMEQAEEVFQRFGLDEDEYEITTGEDGRIQYRRKNLTEDVPGVPINLGNGVVAEVEAASLKRGMPDMPDHPGMTVLRFDFESKEVGEEWLARHDITVEGKWLELEEGAIFCRHDVMPPKGCLEIAIDGATVTVAQTEDTDVPQLIYREVVEEAYGQHGWGMIDFNQAMADQVFSRDAREANYLLWDILDNILFYSYLPLADRQALVMNALNQFAVWLTNLMSALPRAMTDPENRIDLNSQGNDGDNAERSDEVTPEETKETADMGKEVSEQTSAQAKDQETVERQDTSDESQEEVTDSAEEQTEQVERKDETEVTDREKVFTRSEAEDIAKSAVESYIATQEAKRQDDPNVGMGKAIGEAISTALGPVVQRMESIAQEVKEVKSTTIAREDDLDDEVDPSEIDEEVKRKDPFRGAIFPNMYKSA